MEVDGMNKYDYLARLKEPSTYASVAALLAVFGVNVAAPELSAVSMVGAAIAGVLGMFLPERKKTGEGKKRKGAAGA